MSKRTDMHTILVIGSGPIVIGQACEFDYSGTQACIALTEAGYRVVLVNSNPATIMTDPGIADAVYIEPIQADTIETILQQEGIDAVLPTMGGQTGLNCAMELYNKEVLDRYHVALIGASMQAIEQADNRANFQSLIEAIGLKTPVSLVAHNMKQAQTIMDQIGLPAIVRPSFTLGGYGGGIAYTAEDFERLCAQGLRASSVSEIQIDESIIGWKEYELELMRDSNDNSIVICSIENLDPVGVHTGDSITVAPAQTLTDREYQQMRDAAIHIMRAIGVDTGGANVQFAVNPTDGRQLVIEMNPRVSRSSALASKATGYPIAKLAAQLAVGYTLDELANEITGDRIPASFEPVLDYVVTKIPRFDFSKFPEKADKLGTSMQSVGEVMGIGRHFAESLQKAVCSLEQNIDGLTNYHGCEDLSVHSKRLFAVADAFKRGMTVEALWQETSIDPWFLHQIQELVELEAQISRSALSDLNAQSMLFLKQQGFTDSRLALLLNDKPSHIRQKRLQLGCRPGFKRIDTCAGAFIAETDYLYATYGGSSDSMRSSAGDKILILGSGPNRIGQGIEFDYCCTRAAKTVSALGYQTIMVNCNPETVSTDYTISDRLYFEPVILERVLDIVHAENPAGVIVQLGGQTPLKLAEDLARLGVPLLGSDHKVIDDTENRNHFKRLLHHIAFKQPLNTVAHSMEQALSEAAHLGYPLIVRPSYVLAGQGMRIIKDQATLENYLQKAQIDFQHPVLLEVFLQEAVEIEVDAICDGEHAVICGLLEHVERAGVHSGDSSCFMPAVTLDQETLQLIKSQIRTLALKMAVVGFINAQLAYFNGEIYMIEVNPRASRTVPFISKATQIPWVDVAVKCMLGINLSQQGISEPELNGYYVKAAVLPFHKLPYSNPLLGPEMKATGEVMGQGNQLPQAYLKAQQAAGFNLPQTGQSVLITGMSTEATDFALIEPLKDVGFYVKLHHSLDIGYWSDCPYIGNQAAIQESLNTGSITWVLHLSDHCTHEITELLHDAMRYRVYYSTTMAEAKMMLACVSDVATL